MAKVTIAVNARMLLRDRLDGTGNFAFHTLHNITKEHPEVDFIFFFDRKFDPTFIFEKNVKPVVVFPPTRHFILQHIWFQFALYTKLKIIKPDLLLSPDGFLSLHAPCKQLAVIHDLNFVHNTKDLPLFLSLFYNYFFPKFASRANRIATVSEFSKNDLVETYGVSPEKIDVVYNGVDDGYKPHSDVQNIQTKKTFSNGSDYILFVGSLHPRKNIGRLIHAFDQYKTETKSQLKLLIVGHLFWGNRALKKTLKSIFARNDVIFTGRVSNTELQAIMAAANCFIYPPYFEGFGVPIIEAMQSGIPVACSNKTALPEIAGNAAYFFDPYSIAEIKNAIIEITTNNSLRYTLIQAGKTQSKRFTWKKTSDLLWQSIQTVLHS